MIWRRVVWGIITSEWGWNEEKERRQAESQGEERSMCSDLISICREQKVGRAWRALHVLLSRRCVSCACPQPWGSGVHLVRLVAALHYEEH